MSAEKKLNRLVFENAISSMEKHGAESMLNPRIYEKRIEIKNSLLQYYESTEEFEKCKFVVDFFNELENLFSSMSEEQIKKGATGNIETSKLKF